MGLEYIKFKDLSVNSDIIRSHIIFIFQTLDLINDKEFLRMKRSIILINA